MKITIVFLLIPVDCVSLNPCAGTCELEEMISMGGPLRRAGRFRRVMEPRGEALSALSQFCRFGP